MFDETKPRQRKRQSAEPATDEPNALDGAQRKSTADVYKLDLLGTDELLRLYAQVVVRLPATELSKMDLEKELLLQYHSVVALQTEITENPEGVPFNQRAQVANTVSSAIKTLIELQNVVYPQERFKAVESVLIRVLSQLPEKSAAKFLTEYEAAVKKYA